jgi:hypothetical protein
MRSILGKPVAMQKIAGEQHITCAARPVIEAAKGPEKNAGINCRRGKRPDEGKPWDIRPRI